eukprot:2806503-Amphidinium_carterae.2
MHCVILSLQLDGIDLNDDDFQHPKHHHKELLSQERQQRQQGGAYVTPASPNTPTLQQYQDRLDILEDQAQQEEDRRDRLRVQERIVREQEEGHRKSLEEVRRVAAELAEKEHRDQRAREQEELERQAAIAPVPEEQVARQEIPRIGENVAQEAQTVSSASTVSSSTGASTRMERQERQDSADYWENIVEIMYEYFHDENDIGEALSLHEGVLYWRTLEDIKNMEQRSYSNEDPEALREYKWYIEQNEKLDKDLREEYEKYNGAIGDREEYAEALQNKDRDALRNIIFEYAAQRMTSRRKHGKEKYYENKQRRQKKRNKRARDEAQTTSATASAAPSAMEEKKNYDKEDPPRPQRPVPIPERDRVPPTPALQPEVPQLSPRLQLKPENFKNERGQKDDKHYEKKLFDEIRQKSYILQHPTSQYYSSSPEIKRIYDGFVTEDYIEKHKKKIKEVQQRGREDEEVPEECI